MSNLFDDDNDEPSGSGDFAKLFEESLKGVSRTLSPGDRIHGEILSIGKDEVFVSTGTMHDGLVFKNDLLDPDGKFAYTVGQVVDLYVTQVRGAQIMLSPKPTAKNIAEDLEDAYDMMLPVEGKITEICNGGVRVLILGKTAFCPISQLDIRRVENAQDYVGRKMEFRITRFEEGGRNVVVSRRRILEEEKELSQGSFVDEHKVGDVVGGVVMRLEKFGAFIEVAPGLEGLAHISELSWSRVSDPSEAVSLGQTVRAKILKIEESGGRLNISLSVKAVAPEPWETLPGFVREGQIVEGKVVRLMKFGAFVQLAPGIEGLLPLSEMSDGKRIARAEEVVNVGETISVMIKEVRNDERKLLLSLRAARASVETAEWRAAAASLPKQGSLGTLGEQFKTLFPAEDKSETKRKS